LKEEWSKALPWYQDREVMLYSEGLEDRTYTAEEIESMYSYLSGIGQLYFIELKDQEGWKAIGDATYSQTTLPIVIGHPAYRGKGIGKEVIMTFISKAKKEGLRYLRLKEIYDYNHRSIKMFTGLGFKRADTGFILDLRGEK